MEFITLISSEANEISEKEAKKTIACDHITKALEQLGFGSYVPAVLEAASEHKEQQKVRGFPLIKCCATRSRETSANHTNLYNRVARRSSTSSTRAACRWRSWSAYRPNSLLTPPHAITRRDFGVARTAANTTTTTLTATCRFKSRLWMDWSRISKAKIRRKQCLA